MQVRIKYLDAMRGWAMLIVVWVHVTSFVFGAEKCLLSSLGVIYPMPLFFAVSGFLYARRGTERIPWLRWLKLLFFLIGGSTAYAILFGEEFGEMFSMKYYYWFFTALLMCELITSLLHWLPSYWMRIVGVVVVWSGFFVASRRLGINHSGIPWGDLEQYSLFYFLGVTMWKNENIRRILTSRVAAGTGLLLLVGSIYTWQKAGTSLGLVAGLGGVCATWYLFTRYEEYTSVLAWIGRQSFGIFLLSFPAMKLLYPWGVRVPRIWVDTFLQWLSSFAVAVPLTLLLGVVTQLIKDVVKPLRRYWCFEVRKKY